MAVIFRDPGDTSSIVVRIIEFHGHDICLFAQCYVLFKGVANNR